MDDIKRAFEDISIELNETQITKIDKTIIFLQDYCRKVNLTAIRDRDGIIVKHFIDSVLPLTLFRINDNSKCLDIGTGAGFPAVPMMIYRPDLNFTLLDSQRKRTDYLTLLSKEIDIHPEIIHSRAEELRRKVGYKNSYDIVTARALSDLETLNKYAAPFLKRGGHLLAMRGSKDELAPKKNSGFNLVDTRIYSLPNGDGRKLLIYERI